LSRYIEVHSPISAVLAERSQAEKDSLQVQFDGFWSSSLADSTLMGRPDIEALDISSRLRMINDIFDVTSRPLIMDIDTGGQPEHLELNLKSIERLGISAVVLEDKVGLKKNSLLGNDVRQIQSDIDEFANKISLARRTIRNSDFMVIGRIESLILDKGMSDALMRSDAYVDAGADGILIHSRKPTPDEVFTFAKLFKSKHPDVPLIAIPSTYSHVIETELEASGFNVVIYANQLIRASCQAIEKVLKQILDDQTAFSSERDMINLRKLLEIIPGTM
jgi:phosphoenolpyruvate phosphomutase